jgi:hypothetical protein
MKKAIYIILITVLTLLAPHAFAGTKTQTMMVSAKVLPFLSKTMVHQQGDLTITREDIKRGYVEVKAGTVLEVRTNSRGGYILSFVIASGPYREIWVIDGKRTTVLLSMGGFIYQPHTGGKIVETKELSYRFLLSADATPGSYTWPLSVDTIIN